MFWVNQIWPTTKTTYTLQVNNSGICKPQVLILLQKNVLKCLKNIWKVSWKPHRLYFCNWSWSNFMSNHPVFLDVDTLTSQILFIFSLFVDNIEIINPRKFQPSSPYGSIVIEIWKFDQNECFGVKSAILNWLFLQ